MHIRLARAVVLLLTLAACDDYVGQVGGGGGSDTDLASGWCGVQQVFADDCVVCHDASGGLGGLDLESDPYTALVGVVAATDPSLTLVVAGDPSASFLIAKLAGTMASGQGGTMPPGTPLDSATVDLIRQWIADGASDVCDETIDPGNGRHHPDGWDDADQHGLAAKLQEEQCVACHGADLTGDGKAVSCDGCHAEGWRTDCTFCHGDVTDGTGAPPVHITGQDEGVTGSHLPHRAHTTDTAWHLAFDCTTCHTKPTDVLSSGHVFVGDTTPAAAEVLFGGGLSPAGQWSAATGTCSSLYCHGTGRAANGTIVHDRDLTTCHDCHGDMTSEAKWRGMSGEHEEHLDEGLSCSECHESTTANNTSIASPALHVNGVKDVVFAGTMTRAGNGRCTGSCHGENHTSEAW